MTESTRSFMVTLLFTNIFQRSLYYSNGYFIIPNVTNLLRRLLTYFLGYQHIPTVTLLFPTLRTYCAGYQRIFSVTNIFQRLLYYSLCYEHIAPVTNIFSRSPTYSRRELRKGRFNVFKCLSPLEPNYELHFFHTSNMKGAYHYGRWFNTTTAETCP